MSSNTEFRGAEGLAKTTTLYGSISFFCLAFLAFWIMDHRTQASFAEQVDRDLEAILLTLIPLQKAPFQPEAFQTIINNHSHVRGETNVFFRLFNENDAPPIQSDLSSWKDLSLPVPKVSLESKRIFLHPSRDGHPKIKILETPYLNNTVLQMGVSLDAIHQRILQHRLRTGGFLFVLAIIGSIFLGWIIRRQLKAMETVFREASQIIQFGEFHSDIATHQKNETSRWLAQTFNGLFKNIHQLMKETDQILGDVAHDLRTPVARLRSLAESMLSEPDVSHRELELSGRTIEECDHLLGLVNTILEINAAEARTTSLRNEEIDLVSLIEEAIDLFRTLIEDKSHEISADLPTQCIVFGDRRYLQRILANLLDNAIKYTPQGGTIHLTLRREHGQVVFQIIDNGIGIAEEDAALIFNRFYRCDKSRTTPGNGLGLTFCKAIVEAMNGRLTYASNPLGGSIFEILLPDGMQQRSTKKRNHARR